VLKSELLRIPLFGPLMPLTGMIAVDRDGANALRGLVRDGERRCVRDARS
jgi:1-acyl-sn-glycerol-3-phosphate acyltransferase